MLVFGGVHPLDRLHIHLLLDLVVCRTPTLYLFLGGEGRDRLWWNPGGGPSVATGGCTEHQFAIDEDGEPGDQPGHLQAEATDQGHVEEEGWLLQRMDVPGWHGEVHPDGCHAGVLPQLVTQP